MIRSSYKYEEIVSPAERDDMICFVSLEHESRLENPETRATHFSLCMDVKLKFEVLASSKDCPIQMMKQLNKPVYGVQFHPEGYTERPYDRRSSLVNFVYPEGYAQAQPDGRSLLTNFFSDRRSLELELGMDQVRLCLP